MPAEFYDPNNEAGNASRQKACNAALADLLEYMMQDGVRVAAFDATNSSRERRQHVVRVLKGSGLGAKMMFVESVCDQEQVSRLLKIDGDSYRVPRVSTNYIITIV